MSLWRKHRNGESSKSSARKFRPEVMQLEDRCVPSNGLQVLTFPDPLMPQKTTDDLSQVFFIGNKPFNGVNIPAPPSKFITIKNNTPQTIFPILRDANTGQAPNGAFYDPMDNHNQEYRAYIGYVDATRGNVLGLPTGASITINVPLVFWDGANIYFATDGRDLVPTTPGAPNPFEYNHAGSTRVITDAVSATGITGKVMWYTVHGDLAHTPTPDAPAQLTEFTIRDPYLAHFGVNADQQLQLINYDVSYVDSNLLSVAMQAQQVPVPNTQVKADFGWIGSILDQQVLQDAIKKFVANSDNGLGKYFDGLGWPVYFAPAPNVGGLKIPSGANVFANSPLNNTRSKYNNDIWALSSGGAGPLQVIAGGTNDATNQKIIQVTFPNQTARDAFFAAFDAAKAVNQKFHVRISGTTADLGIVQAWAASTATAGTVTVDKDMPDLGSTGKVLEFFRPVTDYASTRIRDIWYAWAKYYVDTFALPNASISGVLQSNASNLLTIGLPDANKVALGMTVSGPGIRPGTIVLWIDPKDKTKVYLNQLPTQGGAGTFNFGKPTVMPYSSDLGPENIINLSFPEGPPSPSWQTDPTKITAGQARLFAASVYTAMTAEAAIPIPLPNDPEPKLPKSMVLVATTIGTDVLHLPNKNDFIGGQVRDLIKSILRGVHDFNQVPEALWYPEPSLHAGNQQFNVFNLNPYVWFVHDRLKLSGYGFSVDDDTADVGANGTDQLLFVVSGTSGLVNKNEWFPNLPWGQISTQAKISKEILFNSRTGKTELVGALQLQDVTKFNQVRPDDPANSVIGAFVWGAGIPAGTNLQAFGPLNQLKFILSTVNVTPSTGFINITFTGKNKAPQHSFFSPPSFFLQSSALAPKPQAPAPDWMQSLVNLQTTKRW